MTWLMWLRVAGVAAILAVLYGGYVYIEHRGYDRCQTKWDADKAFRKIIADRQATKAKETERIADEKSKKIADDYAASQRELAAALKRMRDAQAVPRSEPLPVAAGGRATMPGITQSSGGTDQAAAPSTGTGKTATFYELAMEDTLQCSRLIQWVADQGMAH